MSMTTSSWMAMSKPPGGEKLDPDAPPALQIWHVKVPHVHVHNLRCPHKNAPHRTTCCQRGDRWATAFNITI
jgi:hypothetical protein